MTIYTNKKTGEVFTNKVELEDGRIQLTDSLNDTTTVAASTFKRWYKTELVVDFTETKPNKEKKEKRRLAPTPDIEKPSALKKASNKKVSSSSGIHLGERERTMDYSEMTLKEASRELGKITLDRELGFVMFDKYKRRAYESRATGNVYFVHQKAVVELTDVSARA